MIVTKSYKFIRVRTLEVTKPYKFIWFGAMDGTKPHKFITFGTMDVQQICTFMVGSAGPVRQGPRGGTTIHTHVCGARGPRTLVRQRPRVAQQYIHIYLGPGGPRTARIPGVSTTYTHQCKAQGPRTPGCQHKMHTYVGLRAPVCKGHREAYARDPKQITFSLFVFPGGLFFVVCSWRLGPDRGTRRARVSIRPPFGGRGPVKEDLA